MAFDRLDEILDSVWAAWSEAARQRTHPMHTGALATVFDGLPEVRTVVLRGADPHERTLRFHTDARAPKIGQLRAVPGVRWLFYDPRERVQLTASGQATIHTSGPLWQAAWEQTSLMSRRVYLPKSAPGETADQPISGIPDELLDRRPTAEESEAGATRFAVVTITITEIDWVRLTAQGNRRARWVWSTEQWLGRWLYP